VFDTPAAYDILSVLDPARIQFLEGMVGSGSVQVTTTSTSKTYTANNPLFGGEGDLPLARIEQTEETTIVSLLTTTQEILEGDILTYDPIYTDTTSLIFRIDSDGLEQLG
jgi:hypothetical protein